MSGAIALVQWSGNIAIISGTLYRVAGARGRSAEWDQRGQLASAAGFTLNSAAEFMYGHWVAGWIFAVLAAAWFWFWWRNRPPRNRKKALRELGAKARARVQALVERLDPVPEPA